MKFSSELAGTVTGIRFYKAAANTGTHVGSLWSRHGRLLALGHLQQRERRRAGSRSTSPTRSKSRPYTTYVAGYLAPKGHYSATPLAFAFVGVSNPPLQALASPISSNGVFAYSATSSVPRPAPATPPTTGWTSTSRRCRCPAR